MVVSIYNSPKIKYILSQKSINQLPEPLHQTFLVDKLDAASTDARVEERAVRASLAPAHPADVS